VIPRLHPEVLPLTDASSLPATGAPVVDAYLRDGYHGVVGMSSRFAAAVAARLLAIQTELGVRGHAAEIGTFEGRFFIAMAHALAEGETAVGIDLFDWPNPEVIDRFHANCRKHGVPDGRRVTLKADSRALTPEQVTDLALATATLAEGGIILLDDMLHPGYPTLMVAVQAYLEANPDIVPLCIVDRESIVAATKFALCRRDWFKRYEEKMLAAFKDNIWPLGADFEPHWCLVLAQDTRLAAIE
jgi:hypothetical protein